MVERGDRFEEAISVDGGLVTRRLIVEVTRVRSTEDFDWIPVLESFIDERPAGERIVDPIYGQDITQALEAAGYRSDDPENPLWRIIPTAERRLWDHYSLSVVELDS